MHAPLKEKITLGHLRAARQSGDKMPMLTCYDYSTAHLMQEAGIPLLLVGDSAANVILGHSSTLPISLPFMMEITAAVRRGAPLAYVVADMPFGSYQESISQGVRNVCRMIKRTGCDCVKLEAGDGHIDLIKAISLAGVAVIAHLGLRPQTIGVLGGYRYQGRTSEEAEAIVNMAIEMEKAGAVALLIEAVPPEVARAVINCTQLPVIGCGAGPACHASVIVTHDALGFTVEKPRFVPTLTDIASPLRQAFFKYAQDLSKGIYPAEEHNYSMNPSEQTKFKTWLDKQE
jgi:3-methyl-2-oxobutanoate hydroxymethyltransferase